ncbi:ABC transporter permease [Algoriphagus sp. Y33]|uniref:ABC transporter permease n=1 Tax=Algoriphagus sp. Y33 TaxID=2772483 RepID=UPI00177FF5A4|nr:ABC transporter permease [Algoriphagus sp. Y33]
MAKVKNSPPKLFLHFFRWYCHPRMLDYIEGDLMEVYERNVKVSGKRKADRKFILDVLLLFRPGIIRPRRPYQNLNTYSMYKSYFKIGWRTLLRNQEYAVINIAGLALSITCCILIFALISHHLGFDDFHPEKADTYRIVTEMQSETASYSSGVPTPLGGLIRENQTFWKYIARTYKAPNILVTLKNDRESLKYKEPEGIVFVEPDFFGIFDFPLSKGSFESVLKEPNTAVITERLSKKYFGDDDPVGKSLWVDNTLALTITGVLRDLPSNTDFRSEIVVSYPAFTTYMPWLASENFWSGISGNFQCYTVLNPGVSVGQVEEALAYYAKEYPIGSNTKNIYHLQGLSDIHFNAKYGGAMDKSSLWILSAVGLFLLLTACVNFVNMATAKALRRSKEVGVRKVMGGHRWQLFWQFVFETGIITTLSVVLAVISSLLLLPGINNFFNTQLSARLFADIDVILFILILDVSITLLAGFYPAFILGGFKPIAALKGKIPLQQIGGFNTRRALIVSQFVISQVLVISLLVVVNQMRFAKQSDLGFDKESIVMVEMGSDSVKMNHALKNEFMRIPGVEKVALCSNAPASSDNWNTDLQFDNREGELDFLVNMKLVDEDYASVFNLQLVSGRDLLPSDTVREVLVNEALLHKLGIATAEEAIGRMVTVNAGSMSGPIVGVIKNFHDQSFHREISPTVFTTKAGNYSSFAIKLNPHVGKSSLKQIQGIWLTNYPDQLFEFSFLDESIARFYETEETLLKGVKLFSFIAIFIGCLGLYGLISFMVAQKTKEVGIRKVMGGGVSHIVWLFGREFVRLILIAFVIAAPIGWYLMSNWLQDFEFKIQLDLWTFGIAIGCSFVIAAVTVGYQVIRAAVVNPAVSLKTE